MNGGEEVSREPIMARRDPANIFETREHAFNGISIVVEKRKKGDSLISY